MGFAGSETKAWFGGVLLGALAIGACGSGSHSPGSDADAGSPSGASSSGGLATGGDSRGGAASAGGTATQGGSERGGSERGGSGQAATTSGGAGDGGEPAGAAGAGGEPSVPEGDPIPVEPNLTGLVPHSTQWLLFSIGSSSSYTKDLRLLDLATSQLHDANPGGPLDVIGTLSPDRRTYFFSDGNGSKPSARIIRLEPDGFVPAQQLEGYVGVAGAYRVLSWSFDSRFAVVSRGAGSGSSVEVVDLRLGTRVASETFSSIDGAFAQKGYYYFYDAALVDGFQPKYGRVTQTGSTSPVSLPPDAKQMVFDPDGTQLFYGLGTYPDSDRLFMVSLADGADHELQAASASEMLNTFDAFPVAGDSVVVTVGDQAQTTSVRRRVFLDANKAPVDVTDPARYVAEFTHSTDNNLYTVQYLTSEVELVRVEPYAREPMSATWAPFSRWDNAGFIGYAYMGVSDGLHLARFDGASQVEEVVLGPGKAAKACASEFSYTPLHKLAFVQGDGEALVFVDLDATPPAIRGTVQPSAAGFKLACPLWGDNDAALAFTESDGTTSNTYVTRWTSASPELPVLAGTNLGKSLAVMYR